jgi:hypothetical protein
MEYPLEEDESRAELGAPLLPTPNDDDIFLSISPKTPELELPLPLRLLYGLNGVTLSLPMTALLYIVNTRASMPIEFLSAYGAVAFLPYSLKPFYACMSQHVQRQEFLLVLLLISSGVFTTMTAFIPSGGVVWCFVLAILRGVSNSWPEFLLGLSLIQHARCFQSYSLAAAHLQSQAATARNFGSFLATVIAFGVFLYSGDLTDQVVTLLLVTSGCILNLLAALIAGWFRVGSSEQDGNEALQDCDDDNTRMAFERQSPRPSLCTRLCHKNGRAVVLFQLCIIVFAMEGPIEASVSLSTWSCLMLLLVAALLFTLVSQRHGVKWQRIHRVGLFLIARNAIPDPSYIVSSFLYSQLQSTPVLLQALSIANMGTTTLSSWSFGKIFARYNHGWPLLKLMAGTTLISSLCSLGNLAIVAKAHEGSHSRVFHVVVFCVSAVTTFAAEWQFLPNVVLATAAVGNRSMQEEQIEEVNSDIQDVTTAAAPLIRGNVAVRESTIDSTGILYGTLMSCIDFGDQIGAWVTVPLVTALGISRENDWAGLNEMIVLTSVLGLLSVLLLGILKDERA